ncbi:cytochrome c [Pontibacter aydingkolensis]|uniref:C-type cytochrome n=1 Tax=Pontibacter aydingkolensis TaxID=1911536 RepID=A0ABS7CZL7_9BACT|nr:c-type cytochrome [Pontibacter aydingkolensis]MBW7469258.1 c-type cytochrome [Pontibacter aydingkolensis]
MKNTFTLLGLGLLLVACGGETSENERFYESDYKPDTTQVTGPSPQAAGSANNAVAMDQGAKLISLSDCLACHREDEKLVGPAYVDVANKYEANDKNIDYLAGKIIEGGSGVWGQVPMTPHPNISKEDAREMARYILTLRKE